MPCLSVMSDKTGPDAQLVAVLHGTQSASGQAAHRALVEKVRRLVPGLQVSLCWLDVLSPSLGECLSAAAGPMSAAAGPIVAAAGPIVVVPVLLSTGYHTEVDIPATIAAASGGPIVQAAHLGPDPKIVAAVFDRLVQAGGGRGPTVLVGAGSSDSRAAGELSVAAEQLSRLTNAAVRTAQVGDDFALIGAGADDDIASYLLAPGFFADRLAAAGHGRRVSAPLGDHPGVAEVIVDRYLAARSMLSR